MARKALPDAVHTEQVVAVLRAERGDRVLDCAQVLYETGVRCIEVALTTPGGLELLPRLRSQLGADATIGAGTVCTVDQVTGAVDGGASFALAPNTDADVLDAATSRGLPMVPGAATPTEIAKAWNDGASAVKVFPAAQLGGPGFLKAVREPLPHIPMLPTGGVRTDDVEDYLAAGAVAVGIGSPLMGDALSGGSLDALRERARAFLTGTAGEEAQ